MLLRPSLPVRRLLTTALLGLADPKRLVIAAASYGGYTAMMGLVREPGLAGC